MGLLKTYRVAGPDDPIYKEGLTILTPASARPKPTPQPPPDVEEEPEQED